MCNIYLHEQICFFDAARISDADEIIKNYKIFKAKSFWIK